MHRINTSRRPTDFGSPSSALILHPRCPHCNGRFLLLLLLLLQICHYLTLSTTAAAPPAAVPPAAAPPAALHSAATAAAVHLPTLFRSIMTLTRLVLLHLQRRVLRLLLLQLFVCLLS